jgi:hypothetical protein
MPTAPPNQGYALPLITPTIPRLAPLARASALAANPSSHQLPTRPRSIIDQGTVPCCVSCALAGAMEILHPDWPPLAPLFHYFVTRFDNLGADSNGFLFLDRALQTLTTQGICRLDLHTQPFTSTGATIRPSRQAFTDALTRRLLRQGLFFRYRPLPGPSRVALIREQLRKGFPVVIGFTLPQGYHRTFLNEKKEWQDPNNPARTTSGHCLLVIGYADSRQALLVQDSRGVAEFDRGCWWLGYRVADSSVVLDAYSLT